MAFYQLTYFAGAGRGQRPLGLVAEHVGIPRALLVAALALALGLIVAARYPVGFGEGLNLDPSSRPVPPVVNEPEAEQGPVLVTVEYRIDPQRRGGVRLGHAGTRPLSPAGRSRGLGPFRGCRRARRYLETFMVESWGEHLRQHERATVADLQILETAQSFHLREGPPPVSHLLYAYHQET